MTAPSIELTDLRRHHRGRAVLDIGSLRIDPGATAVLGPNGAGKSTLLRVLATVIEPSDGAVRVAGLDPTADPGRTAIRRRLGYVPQEDGLPARMRVVEYCEYVAALKEIGPRRRRQRWTRWALDRVGLGDRAHDRISTLSGGMRRRLTLAQSLLGGPDLLVLDEPLTSLDASHRAAASTLVVDRARHATVVVATHHADELAAVCDRVLVLDRGTVAFAGTPAELAARAVGRVWDTTEPVAGVACRAIAPGRFRVVGVPPPGATEGEPGVTDGYLTVVADTAAADALP